MVWQPTCTCTFATSRLKSISISYLHIYIIMVIPYRTAKLLLANISRYVVYLPLIYFADSGVLVVWVQCVVVC